MPNQYFPRSISCACLPDQHQRRNCGRQKVRYSSAPHHTVADICDWSKIHRYFHSLEGTTLEASCGDKLTLISLWSLGPYVMSYISVVQVGLTLVISLTIGSLLCRNRRPIYGLRALPPSLCPEKLHVVLSHLSSCFPKCNLVVKPSVWFHG